MTLVDLSIVYPAYKSIRPDIKDVSPLRTFKYTCNSLECTFPMKALAESAELRAIGMRDITSTVVKTISDHQQLFTVKQCGGFVLQEGKAFVVIKNASVDAEDDTVFGFLALTQPRRKLFQDHQLATQLAKEAAAVPQQGRSNIALGCGAAGGVAAIIVAVKLLKHLK